MDCTVVVATVVTVAALTGVTVVVLAGAVVVAILAVVFEFGAKVTTQNYIFF